ncbi:MAG: hypothetical protein GXO66_05650 [Euryarchaeota archaeon]|nr:hypothetical protein [Euryarchaeota archaeon]
MGGEEVALLKLCEILAECALDNRYYILTLLRDDPVSVADIRRALIRAGVPKSYTTVRRYMESLKRTGLVEERRKHFFLTNLGTYIVTCLREMRQNVEVLNSRSGVMSLLTISCLPPRFMHSIRAIKHAEYVQDPFSFIAEFLMHIQRARERICVLSDRVSPRFNELIGGRVAEGVAYTGISGTESAEESREQLRRVAERMGLTPEEREEFWSRCCLRECDSVPLHIIVVDGRVAGINFPCRDGRVSLNGAFMSSEREFVEWAEEILDYYRKRSRAVQLV